MFIETENKYLKKKLSQKKFELVVETKTNNKEIFNNGIYFKQFSSHKVVYVLKSCNLQEMDQENIRRVIS